MRVRVQKWGNSLALRIPKSFATETALDSGAEVDITLEDGRLVITPLSGPRFSLADLLAQVSSDNIHAETDTGAREGAEAW